MARVEPSRLFSQLLNTGLQNKDQPLYQVIYLLIDTINKINAEVNTNIVSGGGGGTTVIGQGSIGSPGIDGIDGEDGFPLPGERGIQGITGAQGPVGPVAFIEDGLDGNDGFNIPNPGPAGATGATGAVGPAVLFIEDQLQGEDGIPGPTGPPGNNDIYVVADVDESLNLSVALQDDDELFFSVDANSTYWVKLVCWFTSGTSLVPDVKFTFTSPAGATFSSVAPGLIAAATATTDVVFGGNYRLASGAAPFPRGILSTATIAGTPFIVEGILRTDVTAGTFRLQWAQNTSNAEPTVRKADSFFKFRKVA